MSLDGRALVFVAEPGCSLAGPVAVVGELALPTAVQPLLPLEAGVTDDVCQAARTEGHLASVRSCHFCTPELPTATEMNLSRFLVTMEKRPTRLNRCVLAWCCCCKLNGDGITGTPSKGVFHLWGI